MATKPTVRKPAIETETRRRLEDMYQVVLYNDDHHAMEYVVLALMKVFGHNQELAIKIMYEAHRRGRAIAEVEGEAAARRHGKQLQELGLTADIEKV